MYCKIMGEVAPGYCYECYYGNHADLEHKPASRVLCKKENMVGEPLKC